MKDKPQKPLTDEEFFALGKKTIARANGKLSKTPKIMSKKPQEILNGLLAEVNPVHPVFSRLIMMTLAAKSEETNYGYGLDTQGAVLIEIDGHEVLLRLSIEIAPIRPAQDE
jgi:hypothetical protein